MPHSRNGIRLSSSCSVHKRSNAMYVIAVRARLVCSHKRASQSVNRFNVNVNAAHASFSEIYVSCACCRIQIPHCAASALVLIPLQRGVCARTSAHSLHPPTTRSNGWVPICEPGKHIFRPGCGGLPCVLASAIFVELRDKPPGSAELGLPSLG